MMNLRNFWSRTKHQKTQRQQNIRNKHLIISSIQDEIKHEKSLRVKLRLQAPISYVSCYPVVNFQLFSNPLMSTHMIQIHTDCVMSVGKTSVLTKTRESAPPATAATPGNSMVIFISKMVDMSVDRFIQNLIQDDTLHNVLEIKEDDNVHLLFKIFMSDVWRCLMYHVLKFGSNYSNKIKAKNTVLFPVKGVTTQTSTATRKVQVQKILLLQKDCLLFDELTLNDIVNNIKRDCFAQFSQIFRPPCDLTLDITQSDLVDDAIENQMFYDRKLELIFTLVVDANFKESVRNYELSIGEDKYQNQVKSVFGMLDHLPS